MELPLRSKSISYGITAFIDILGFSDGVLKATKLDDIQRIVKDIKTVQREFEAQPDTETREVNNAWRKTVLAFSDSIVVHLGLQSEVTRREGTFDPVMFEIVGMAYAQMNCVIRGLFLRGGIELGWWYRRGNTLVSQGLVGAYGAETQARVPVISLTDELQAFLAGHQHRRSYSPDNDPLASFRRFDDGIRSCWYIDYLPICAKDVGPTYSQEQKLDLRRGNLEEKEKEAIHAAAYKAGIDGIFSSHARAIEKAYASVTAPEVKSKYVWLASYHNETAPSFTESPKAFCELPK